MARTTKTVPAKKPGSVTTARTSRYNPNPGRGEFIVKIGEKEALIQPSFGALVKIEHATGKDFFTLLHDVMEGPVPLTLGVFAFEAMNEGDYLSQDEIWRHFLSLVANGEIVILSSIIGQCFSALADPDGLNLKKVPVEEIDADPKT